MLGEIMPIFRKTMSAGTILFFRLWCNLDHASRAMEEPRDPRTSQDSHLQHLKITFQFQSHPLITEQADFPSLNISICSGLKEGKRAQNVKIISLTCRKRWNNHSLKTLIRKMLGRYPPSSNSSSGEDGPSKHWPFKKCYTCSREDNNSSGNLHWEKNKIFSQ